MRSDIRIIKSRRRTIALEVTNNGDIILRAPWYASRRDIERFAESKEDWLESTLKKLEMRHKEKESSEYVDANKINELAKLAKKEIPSRVEYFANIIGVEYGRIAIRHQKTRWGSCSSKGNLNFNCLLMLVPEDVRDYVIVHELCHLIELNHSPRFWAEVAKYVPDYKVKRKWLKENGGKIINTR
ncbi:MAG: M48 family metallopeptidase [Lachnospiraceae bacterium]|nr:M48 family metallopeptidase [Candidatus Colinaster scatohippi]